MYSNNKYLRPRERRYAEGERPVEPSREQPGRLEKPMHKQPEWPIGPRKSGALGLKPARSRPGQPASDVESKRMDSVYQKSKSDIEMYSKEIYRRLRERRWAEGERPVEPSRAQIGRLEKPTYNQPGRHVGSRKSGALGLKPARSGPEKSGQPASHVESERMQSDYQKSKSYSTEEYVRPRERRWAEGERPVESLQGQPGRLQKPTNDEQPERHVGHRKFGVLGLKPARSRPGKPASDVESERTHSVYQKSKSDIEIYSNEEYRRPRERRWAEGEQPGRLEKPTHEQPGGPVGPRKSGLGLKPARSRPEKSGQPTSDMESERTHSDYQKSKSDIEMYSNDEYPRPRERRWAESEQPVEPSLAQPGRLEKPTHEQLGWPVGPRKSRVVGSKPAGTRPGKPGPWQAASDVESERPVDPEQSVMPEQPEEPEEPKWSEESEWSVELEGPGGGRQRGDDKLDEAKKKLKKSSIKWQRIYNQQKMRFKIMDKKIQHIENAIKSTKEKILEIKKIN